MKKKVATSKRPVTSVKRSVPKKSRASQSSVVSYQRIIIFSACVVLAVVATVLFNKPAVTQSVAGVSVAKGLFAQATVALPDVDGAISYNIYYKKSSDAIYEHAVRNIPVTEDSYTISYLTRGAAYDYKIVAVNTEGEEFWFTPTRQLTTIEPM